jgi:hypothetical protein
MAGMVRATTIAIMSDRFPKRPYDAVVFDLLTALLDSWTLWNDVAGSAENGLRWRKRYLEITYGCGAYRPYETLVREAAEAAGLGAGLADRLESPGARRQVCLRVSEVRCRWPSPPIARPGSVRRQQSVPAAYSRA